MINCSECHAVIFRAEALDYIGACVGVYQEAINRSDPRVKHEGVGADLCVCPDGNQCSD